jgi:hypothetical protein
MYVHASMPLFSFYVSWRSSGSFFVNFFSVAPHRASQPAAKPIPGGNPPGDWQTVVGWEDEGFEPGTVGQQSGTLPLSHHASINAICYVRVYVVG